ncbi:MAG TPA: cytochrome P450 [Streptosporangiaceae bacterium]|nr:cytochrome P450 [Streptosporangiaceae bacterium]
MTAGNLSFTDPEFWQLPLSARMAHFAELREQGPFTRAKVTDPLTGEDVEFHAVTRYAEVTEISRRPQDFCSGRGSTAIADIPEDAMEFFGSFIVMDDPRHARQRGIVSRAFTPRQLQRVLDSVEAVCSEVIDGFCEAGEADLVESLSQPFPLLVICDMMGIPRSEYTTVLKATNTILGAGDPETTGGREDVLGALLEAGMQLTELMKELAAKRRAEPADDLTSALVHADVGEDVLAPHELGAFFILLAVAGNDTTRTAISLGMHLLGENPGQRAAWQADPEGLTPSAVEEIVRAASPVTFMRRTATRPAEVAGHLFSEGDKVVLFYGAANRDPRVFPDPERFDVRRRPNPHVGFGGPGPHYCLGAHLARRELSVAFRQLFERLPDIEVAGDPVPLQAVGIPLVGGVKHLPVRFTPTRRRGAA